MQVKFTSTSIGRRVGSLLYTFTMLDMLGVHLPVAKRLNKYPILYAISKIKLDVFNRRAIFC